MKSTAALKRKKMVGDAHAEAVGALLDVVDVALDDIVPEQRRPRRRVVREIGVPVLHPHVVRIRKSVEVAVIRSARNTEIRLGRRRGVVGAISPGPRRADERWRSRRGDGAHACETRETAVAVGCGGARHADVLRPLRLALEGEAVDRASLTARAVAVRRTRRAGRAHARGGARSGRAAVVAGRALVADDAR